MAAVAPPLSVTLPVINAMTAFGLNLSEANILVTKIFMDDFTTCKDILNKDIDDALKNIYIFTIPQRQIRLLLASKQKIKAFAQ